MEVMPGYKQTDVGTIPIDWDVKPLGEIGKSLIGLTYRPSEVRKTGTLVLRSSNVQRGTLCFDDNVFVESDIPERIMVRPGDILVCVRNGSRDLIGKSALIDERAVGMTFGAFMGVFRSEYGQFLSHVFQSGIFKKQISEHLGATINQITNKSLNSFKVSLPPTGVERTKISSALNDLDALLDSLDRLIAKKRDLKQAAMQQLLTGQTRLPGFSGEWEEKRLGDLAQMGSGGTPPSSVASYYDGNIPWVSIADMTKGGKIINSTDRNISAEGFANSAAQMFPVGTILYAMYASLGECSIAGISLCSSQAILGIKPNEKLLGEFLYYFLVSLKPMVKTLGQQGTQSNLNKGMVQGFMISLPVIAEQRAIVSILEEMDAELTALEQRRDKTTALKQGMMQELLTGRTRLV